MKALGRDGEATPSRRAAAAGGRRSGGRPFATRALGPSAKFASSTDCSCAAEIGGLSRAHGELRAGSGEAGRGRTAASGRARLDEGVRGLGRNPRREHGRDDTRRDYPVLLERCFGSRGARGRASVAGALLSRRRRRRAARAAWAQLPWVDAGVGTRGEGWRRGWRGMEGAGRTGRDALGEHPLGQARANRQVAHVHAPVLACRLAGAAKGGAEGARRAVHPLEAIPEALGLYRGSAPDQQ